MRRFFLGGLRTASTYFHLERLRSGRLHRYAPLWNPILKRLRASSASVEGHTLFLDSEDSLHLSVWGTWEPYQTSLIKNVVKPGYIACDIGAHIGYYTLLLARSVGARGHVLAFEPNPDNFALLSKNVSHNGYSNVTLFPKALSNVSGKTSLYLSDKNTGDNRLYDPKDGRRSVEIETVRLDDLVNDPPDLIKMDVQGAEGAVLEGMPSILGSRRNLMIFMEFWPAGLASFGSNPRHVLQALFDHGFRLLSIEESTCTLTPVASTELLTRLRTEDDALSLFCVREESR